MSIDLNLITCAGRSQAQRECNKAPPGRPLSKGRRRECDTGAAGVEAGTRQASK